MKTAISKYKFQRGARKCLFVFYFHCENDLNFKISLSSLSRKLKEKKYEYLFVFHFIPKLKFTMHELKSFMYGWLIEINSVDQNKLMIITNQGKINAEYEQHIIAVFIFSWIF